MAFCKICTCGKKVIFERRFSFPDQCPDCGRRLMDFQTYSEEELPARKEEVENAMEEGIQFKLLTNI